VRPEKSLTADGTQCISDYIESFLKRLIHNQNHLSLFSIKEKMEEIVHPLQLPHIEKEIENSFYKYYQSGIKNECTEFSISSLKKWIKNEVDTFCYTDLLYISACVEYLCLEICEISGKIANEDKKIRVTAEHVDEAIETDEALSYTFNVKNVKNVKRDKSSKRKKSRK
jgi:hypothetical protein